MVDHSGRLIGVHTGVPGGTFKTISYGKKQDLDIVLIDEKKFSNDWVRHAVKNFKRRYPKAYEELGR